MSKFSLISTQAELTDLVARSREAKAVALDTEFVWERTYYPRLGLVQLAFSPKDVYLIDAPTLDLSPLGDLLTDSGVVKLLHDAVQDLTILRRATGTAPQNVFDTQRAAGMIGLGASVSLQNLLASTVNVRLSKSETRSDWLRRPLSDTQLEYAADDVRYMIQAYENIRQELAGLNRESWAEEEMRLLNNGQTYEEDDPEQRYRSIKGKGRKGFRPRDYAVLQHLAAWRELEARYADKPRGHIVPDDVLIDLAQKKPSDPRALRNIRSISDKAAREYGDEILAIIAEALASDPETWPSRPDAPQEDPTVAPRLDFILAGIRGRGEREKVDPQLVASRSEVEKFILRPEDSSHRFLSGWRESFIGKDLLRLLEGTAAIRIAADGLPEIVSVAG